MVTKRRLFISISVIISIILVWIVGAWLNFLYSPLVTAKEGVRYTVRPGSSMRSVTNELIDLNIIKQPYLFKLFVQYKNGAHRLKAGEYLFPKGTTSPRLLYQITTGTGIVYHAFTIIPGWTFHDVRKALAQNSFVKHTIENIPDDEIMQKLGEGSLKPEGKFFPDTYFFATGTEDIALLKRAHKTMEKKLDKAWQSRDPNIPFKTSYEALIAASIIEKEFYIKQELPKIAGVLINRLRKNMLLQFDPTVVYGKGADFSGTITKSDLRANNPFNTYVNKGLPPTPISMPSLAAIDAVMHPMQHDYYYFVAHQAGYHVFSKELQEHYQAVAEVKKTHWFFNRALIRTYLLNSFTLNKELNG